MDNVDTKNKNQIKEKHHCKWVFDYTEEGYLDSPFGYRCTKECLNEYIKVQEELIESIKARIEVFKSLKIYEDGTLPKFNFIDVCLLYQGIDDLINKDIQDLFKVNLLDINIPFLIKRKDIPPTN